MATSDKAITFTVSTPIGSVLAQKVQALSAGANVLLADTGLSTTADQYNWQSRFFYDSARGYAVATGKKQSPITTTWVGQYNEASNSWTGSTFQFPRTTRGHVYEGYTYDPATGRTYFLENGGAVDRIAVHEIGTAFNVWTYVGDNPETKGLPAPGNLLASTGNFVTNSNCMAHHPNFYGSGIGGLLIGCHFGFAGYRISNDSYSTVISKSAWSALFGGGTMDLTAACYVAGLDVVLFSAGGDGNVLWKLSAGGTVTQLTNTTIRVGPDSGGGLCMKLVDDPNGGTTCYGLEAAGSKRVWKFNNATGAMDLQGYTHPFVANDGNDENFFFAACKPAGCTHGAIWGIEQSSSGWRSRLWRPNT